MKFNFLYHWIGMCLLVLFIGNRNANANPTKIWSFAPVCNTPTISTFPSTENFDALVSNNAGLFSCITTDNMTDCWVNDPLNTNMWIARSSSTGSGNTGPTTDNTTGATNYVFLEASSCPSVVSTLQGPIYDISSLTAPFISFHYHMWGSSMGSLALEATTDGITWTQIWTLSGDQGDAWLKATVNLSAYMGATTLSFRFVGTTGTSFTSDMAIDDVTVENIACPSVSGLTATSITTNSALLGWVAEGTETQWMVEYGIIGFTPGSGTIVTTTANPYMLTGLMPATMYDFYVTADCGANGMSGLTGPLTFETLCAILVAPFCEDFENAGAIPVCWESSSAEPWEFDTSAGHAGNGGTLVDHTTGTGYFAWVDDSSPHSLGTTLLSPLVDVSGLTVPQVSFWIASDNEGGTNVDFSVNVWDGAIWNNAVLTSNTNTGGWIEMIVDLSTFTLSGPVQIAFVVDENNGTDFLDDFAIDDVCFREAPSCPTVSNLTEMNVLATSATLGWTAGGTETQWVVEYGPSGFTPGTGTMVTATMSPYMLTGLMVNTSYDYYVTADCGMSGLSLPIGPGTFITQCSPVAAPWCGDFESGGSTPSCWRNLGAEEWKFSIGPIAGGHVGNGGQLVDHTTGTGYFAWVDDSSPHSLGSTLQTPLVDISGLITPEVSFWVASDNEGVSNVDFSVNLWDGAVWNNNVYMSNTNTNGWLEVVIDLSTFNVTGPIMLTFVVDENNGSGFYDDLAIDDVCFRNTPVCPIPANLSASNVTESTADLSWASTGTAFNIEYGPCGFTKGTGATTTSTVTSASISGLTAGTCYEYYVQNDCGGPIANLVISGIGDGPLPGGQPKFIELYATGPIADLGIYGLESANNGGGANLPEFIFPAGVSIAQGSFIYITGDSAAFNMFFGFDADFIDSPSTGINGDDAVVLYENGVMIDVAGDPNMDGSGTPWEYLDGWMYRMPGAVNSATFSVTDWVYSGINVFDGQLTNAGSPVPFPLGTFDPPVSICAGPFAFTTLVGCGGPFYDNGGPANVYANNSNDTITICPQLPGDVVTVAFTAFSVEPRTDSTCWDGFYIFDGGSSNSPVIPSTMGTDDWCWDALATPQFGTGNLAGMSITSTDSSGCLTFVLDSDGTVAFDGWEATVSCGPPPCPDPSMLGATNITHNSADLTWVSPGTGHVVEFDTTGFTPGTGSMVGTGASPYTLSGLIPNTTYDYYLKNNCGNATSDLQIVGIMDGNPGSGIYSVVLYANNDIPNLGIYQIQQSTDGGGVSQTIGLPAGPLTAGSHYYIAKSGAPFLAYFGFAPDFVTAIVTTGNDAVGLIKSNVLIDIYGDYNVNGTGTAWEYTSGWAFRNNNASNNGGTFDPANWNINPFVTIGSSPNSTQPVPFPVNAFAGSIGLGLSQCIGPFTFTTLCSQITTIGDTITNVSCIDGADGSIDITPTNGVAPYTYSWSNGSTMEDPTGLAPGSYVVSIVDAVGCPFVSAPYLITEPLAITIAVDGFSNVSCNGGADGTISITPSGGTPPYTFDWSNGATTEDASGLTAGTYTGTITDSNGCTFVAGPVNITEPAMPVSFTLDAVTDASCNGAADGIIMITATGGTPPYSYSWSNGATTEDATGLTAGTYSGTITDANGCTLASGPGGIVEPTAIGVIVNVQNNVTCNGGADGEVLISTTGGTPPYSFMWSNGAITEDATGLPAGTYTGTITDSNGCVLISPPIVITEPAPILLSATHVDATPTGGGTDGSIDLMVSGGTTPYTFLWDNGATSEDLTGISLGAYTVLVTDANGCTETLTQQIGNTAVEDIDELQKFDLFPNPTNGQTQLVLEFEKPVDLNIRVVNVLGQVIYEESDNQVKANQYSVDMSKAAAGTYFVHLQVEGAVRTKQLVVTR